MGEPDHEWKELNNHHYKKTEWTEGLRTIYPHFDYTSVPLICERCGYVVIRDRRTYTPKFPEIQDCDLAMMKVIHES